MPSLKPDHHHSIATISMKRSPSKENQPYNKRSSASASPSSASASNKMANKLVSFSSDSLKQYLEHATSLTSLVDSTTHRKPLILDCRPFLIHSESHIIDALNVHCPPILRYIYTHSIYNLIPCS